MIVMLFTAQCPPIAGSPQGRKDLIIVSLVCDLSAEMWGTQRPGVSRTWRVPMQRHRSARRALPEFRGSSNAGQECELSSVLLLL